MSREMGRDRLLGLFVLAAASAMVAAVPVATRADELKQAQDSLASLRERYGDQHPRLTEARLRMAIWQRLQKENRPEPLVLQRAWVERDVLRLKYLEKHPAFAAQEARVTAMETQIALVPGCPDELLEAAGELAALGSHLGPKHPKYLDQSRRVAALRQHLLAPGTASAELRLARAMQEYYGGRYDVNHPKMREIAAEIARLERN
jgi:hypothetical protein